MMIQQQFPNGQFLRVEAVSDGIVRVRFGPEIKSSIAERYGIVDATPDPDGRFSSSGDSLQAGGLTVRVEPGRQRLVAEAGGVSSEISLLGWDGKVDWVSRSQWLRDHLEHWYDKQNCTKYTDEHYSSDVPPFGAAFTISPEDRIYGFGEAANEFLVFNGKTVLNRVLYTINEIPIPLAMSSRGWGVFFNTSWWHGADIGARDPGELYFYGVHGDIDFFLLYGGTLHGLIQKYTRLTGAPCLIPKWMYGLSYIANYHARNFDVLQDARDFRREGVSCDMISLEPGWMQQEYDFSTKKDWSEQKFMVRDWMRTRNGDRKNNYPGTFVSALRRYGFKLSLWLCCRHDITAEEERRAGSQVDYGIEPWFEHLKKFVNDGVDGFKLDPADYTDMSDPAHTYANGMSDPEIHNLLQSCLSKQMHVGFEEHTGLRPMHHFCGGYSGIQRWGAATCGDSGGGPKSLGWIINLGMNGMLNATCDMEMHAKERMHYALFTAWPLLDSWAGFFQPWYAGEDIDRMFREYVRLRYSIVPYSYSAALEGYLTSMPIVRSMPLAFPGVSETWNSVQQYMYGPYMLISAFTGKVYLPEGRWLDMWTNVVCEGGRWQDLNLPENRGGGFFLKCGAIVPMWGPRDYIDGSDEQHMELMIYPGGSSRYQLYEDDGLTNAYRRNEIASTLIECEEDGDQVRLVIHPRQGFFAGMKDERDWKVTLIKQEKKPTSVMVNSRAVDFTYQDRSVVFSMAGAGQSPSRAWITK
jgi:alpha-glucosidase